MNIRILRLKKKLDYKQLKFFKMLKKINTQIYKLNLFIKYKKIYFIFYISLLKFWYSRNDDLKWNKKRNYRKKSKNEINHEKNNNKRFINKSLIKRFNKND